MLNIILCQKAPSDLSENVIISRTESRYKICKYVIINNYNSISVYRISVSIGNKIKKPVQLSSLMDCGKFTERNMYL